MFNVGDIVKGLQNRDDYHRGISFSRSTFEVMSTDQVIMSVRVLSCPDPRRIGSQFFVEQSWFELVSGPAERQDLSVWVARDGSGIPFREMTTAHLTNVIAMLYREGGKGNDQRSKLVSLEKELLRRLKETYKNV